MALGERGVCGRLPLVRAGRGGDGRVGSRVEVFLGRGSTANTSSSCAPARVAFRLAGGGLGDDRREPPAGVGHPDGERDDELADQVAACLIAVLRRAEGDGHLDAHGEAIGEFSPAAQQLAQAAGGDRQGASLTVAFWACAVCFACSRLAGMRARLGSEPTVCTRLPGPASRWDESLYEHGSISETVTRYRLRRSCVVHLRRDRDDLEP